jgi:acetyl-CoA synthetase
MAQGMEKVLEWDSNTPTVKWLEGEPLNVTGNFLDRHLITRGEKTASLFEPNGPKETAQHITYNKWHVRVCKFADILKSQGIKKGDRVGLYLTMIPELALSVLACARIETIHSMAFAGFSAAVLSNRINDCNCKMVICSDGSYRGAKILDLKSMVDEALEQCDIKTVLVVKRTEIKVPMKKRRNFWVAAVLENASKDCPIEIMETEDTLFILYTSGSIGKPKGMLHTTAGCRVDTAYTFKTYFNIERVTSIGAR